MKTKTRRFIDPFRGEDPTDIGALRRALKRIGCGLYGELTSTRSGGSFYVLERPEEALPYGSQGLSVSDGQTPDEAVLKTWNRILEYTADSGHGALLFYKEQDCFPKDTPGGPGRYSNSYFCCFWNPKTVRFEQATTDSAGTWITVPEGEWGELVTL